MLNQCSIFFQKDKADFTDLFDTNKYLLGFTNGVYDLENNVFRPGMPEDLISINTGYEYTHIVNEEIRKDIMNFQYSLFRNPEVSEYLIKLDAYNLSGNKYLEEFWVHTGEIGRAHV